ncbi:hypothetical protein [Ottowia cancrivicina]|uniref:Transposase n=1 Tax=Ottowia cancrivicina TaxID=3040346 RepID=A0AAW6RNF0_9BURK|nr:hypothetical protein [Ottowia sp. 10c7w1]MDG9699858.1 hypothetical protein [Ottowia sp. 10c7w1]
MQHRLQALSRQGQGHIWQKLFDAVSNPPDMQYAMADSTTVKVHRHSPGAELKAKP